MADDHKPSQPVADAKGPAEAPAGPPPPAAQSGAIPAHPAPPKLAPGPLPPTQSVEIKGTVKIEQITEGHSLDWLGSFGWPVVALIAIYLLRWQIREMIAAFSMRIREGADFEFPWGSIKSGTVKQRDQRAEREAEQIGRDEVGVAHVPPQRIKTIKSRYLLAEDLALQALQAEFDVPVNANITTGGQQFDGMFGLGDIGYLVEVKLVRSPKSEPVARRSLLQLSDAIKRIGWKKPRGMLVIVYDTAQVNIDFERQQIEEVARTMPVVIEVRTYFLQALAERFKVTLPTD